MEFKKTKPVPASVKSVKIPPPETPPSRRRFLLWFFLLLMVGGAAGMALFYRLIPLGPDMEAKLEPYLLQAESVIQKGETYLAGLEPYIEKAKIWKSTEEEKTAGAPKTNFPLVDLEEKKGAVTAPPVSVPGATPPTIPGAQASSTILGPSSIASAAPAQPAAGTPGAAATKPATVPMNAETMKVYAKLSKLYGAMKAEEAVAVFNNLEDEQVILILSRMEEDAAAKILAVIEPKRAARLTQTMIKRK